MIKTPHCIILNQLLFPLHGILIFAHFKTVYLHFAQYLAAIKSLKLHKMCHSEIFKSEIYSRLVYIDIGIILMFQNLFQRTPWLFAQRTHWR